LKTLATPKRGSYQINFLLLLSQKVKQSEKIIDFERSALGQEPGTGSHHKKSVPKKALTLVTACWNGF
jgi:hypothetical protein